MNMCHRSHGDAIGESWRKLNFYLRMHGPIIETRDGLFFHITVVYASAQVTLRSRASPVYKKIWWRGFPR